MRDHAVPPKQIIRKGSPAESLIRLINKNLIATQNLPQKTPTHGSTSTQNRRQHNKSPMSASPNQNSDKQAAIVMHIFIILSDTPDMTIQLIYINNSPCPFL